MKYLCHKLSDVQSEKIGERTTIWQFVVVLPGAEIGKNCNINSHVFIENDVIIGNNVTVKSGVQIWDGITLEDNVFIGPNVTFTNDLIPRSKQYPTLFSKINIKKGASIGANATIIAGNQIKEFALIGAGSVVTKDVGKNELWVGNPAKHIGFVTEKGEILDLELKTRVSNKKYYWNKGILTLSND
jgi:UDP-2-acetamido-3-amino-2,3-dideoxy-glucuronate N-acetyltransferase